MSDINIRDEIELDIKSEIDNFNDNDIDNKNKVDDSYDFLMNSIKLRFENKDKHDNSLSKEEYEDIVYILDDDRLDWVSAMFRALSYLYGDKELN